jgi:CHAT domain-containing protein
MTAAEREREEEFQAQLVSLNRQLGVERAAPKPNEGRLADLTVGLEKARSQYSDFRTNLYAAHPELRAQRGQIEPISLSDAAKLLPDIHTAVLEFVVADEKTYLFVLTRRVGSRAVDPELNVHSIDIPARDLGKETEEFRRQLSLRDFQFRSSALRLFDTLVRPVQSQLSGITNLLIVPDGPLWNLPFQALQSRPGHYLLQDYALSYAPSLTVLREMVRLRLRNQNMPAITVGQTLMAMGDPLLATSTSQHARLTYRDESLSPLPEAAKEVKTLGRLYGQQQSKVFVGGEATEDRFKAEAGEFRILHLATHGLLNETNPMYSHVLLSSGEPSAKEDGLLEAWEIMNLDLHAELTVLSACETARGRITSGEGVIGLAWAFFVAGVPTTVVSQWKVESASTSELMLAFHRSRKIANGQAVFPFHTARALQRAELRLLRDQRYAHPFYWAGFVVVGDPQ